MTSLAELKPGLRGTAVLWSTQHCASKVSGFDLYFPLLLGDYPCHVPTGRERNGARARMRIKLNGAA